jgi:nitroimidazol reductase NimA-like FMN-containing flavoprotein (pyridoxamine 5'-phosphate oxidase superfamily)
MSPITELPRDECMELLGAGQLGRVAISTPMGPRIVPVNYRMHDGDVVFRTTPHSVLGTYGWDSELAFEVDHIDERARAGWSVVALGKGQLVDDMNEVNRIRLSGDPKPWPDGPRNVYLRLFVREVSGRRVGGDRRVPMGSLASMLSSNYLG